MYSKPKTIMITGASSGIGEALALHYAADDIVLCLTGRDPLRLETVAESCRAKGALVDTWAGDVCNSAGIKSWIADCDQTHTLNLVIANAGVALGSATVEGLQKAATNSFNINVNGVFNTIHPALELMSKRRPYPVANAQVAASRCTKITASKKEGRGDISNSILQCYLLMSQFIPQDLD